MDRSESDLEAVLKKAIKSSTSKVGRDQENVVCEPHVLPVGRRFIQPTNIEGTLIYNDAEITP